GGQDVFAIESEGGTVEVRGSTPVAALAGVHWYLKYHCHCQVSWCGDQLNLPDPLPALQEEVRRVSRCRHRAYLNYCTFGYTMAWWDWSQWEREIDWMALNGV